MYIIASHEDLERQRTDIGMETEETIGRGSWT